MQIRCKIYGKNKCKYDNNENKEIKYGANNKNENNEKIESKNTI